MWKRGKQGIERERFDRLFSTIVRMIYKTVRKMEFD